LELVCALSLFLVCLWCDLAALDVIVCLIFSFGLLLVYLWCALAVLGVYCMLKVYFWYALDVGYASSVLCQSLAFRKVCFAIEISAYVVLRDVNTVLVHL
jgi:hypothetical protein